MKNKEKFAKEIVEIACTGKSIAVDENGNITACRSRQCKRCIFSGIGCEEEIIEWAESECEELKIQPEVKECKVDDKILISIDGTVWEKRHFAGYDEECGLVFVWIEGKTSWTTTVMCSWEYAKLPESE